MGGLSDGTSNANRASRPDPGCLRFPSAAGTGYHGGNRISSSAEQDSIKIVGSTWMRTINSGYFD
jgi:hypothetical protein